jgi:hypothetical protein
MLENQSDPERRTCLAKETSIRPLSQPFYPGRLNPSSDPLLGPQVIITPDQEDAVQRNETCSQGLSRRETPPHTTQNMTTGQGPAGILLNQGRMGRSSLRERSPDRNQRSPSPSPGANHILPPPQARPQRGWERERQLRGFSMPVAIVLPTISMGTREADRHY